MDRLLCGHDYGNENGSGYATSCENESDANGDEEMQNVSWNESGIEYENACDASGGKGH